MTINYTDPSADTRFTPTAHDEVRTNNLSQDNAFRDEAVSEETIVPIYARKAPKKNGSKMILMAAAPVAVVAVALGAWALTSSGERAGTAGETQVAAAEAQSTSRLMAADTAPAAPLAVSESLTPTPVEATSTPAPVARAAAPAPRATPAPARRAAPAPARRAASATRTEGATPAAAPITPRPYEPVNITPAPSSSAPTPESSAPLVVVPTRTLPAEPSPSTPPPATPEQPGGAS
ncbi:MAG TPA: hypothetical protein VEA15_02660 [Caulobacteraceae bacterium]|nr:hypothetical protein [Caulobacteraceae bacterium]